MKALVQEFWYEEDGLQTVEMVLILIVLVSLVWTFQRFAGQWLKNIYTEINTEIDQIVNEAPMEVFDNE